jgi:hypothetical protein
VHRRAQDVGGHQPVAQPRLVVDLVLHQPLQQTRALGVADQHEATGIAVVGDVGLEGVDHVAVGDRPGIGAGHRGRAAAPIMLSVSWRYRGANMRQDEVSRAAWL